MLGVWRLQLLREVARRGTVRAAAAAMSITPSAVSQQLRLLEVEAGVALVERDGRLVRLTEAGLMLVRHADTITAAIVAAESELAASRDDVPARLRVAAFPTAARAILPPIIAPSAGATRVCASRSATSRRMRPDGPRRWTRSTSRWWTSTTSPRGSTRPGWSSWRSSVIRSTSPCHRTTRPAGRRSGSTSSGTSRGSWTRSPARIYQAVLRACRRSGFEPARPLHLSRLQRDHRAGRGRSRRGDAARARTAGPAPSGPASRPSDPPLERTVMVAIKPERRGPSGRRGHARRAPGVRAGDTACAAGDDRTVVP